MAEPIATAIFDLDHTVTSWDTGSRLFAWLLRQSIWKMAVGLLAAPVLGPLFLIRRTRRVPLRFGAWLATFGHTHEALQTLARDHVAQISASGEPFVRQDARERIEFHQGEGHIVVIATGAPEILAREILAAEGVRGVDVVGSTLRRYRGGMIADQHCQGEQKVRMLQMKGHIPPWAYVYADHEADLPLLRSGIAQFLVNPKPRAVARIRSALGSSVRVVSWH